MRREKRLIDADVLLDDLASLYEAAGWAEHEVHFSLLDIEENIEEQEEIEITEVVKDTVKEMRQNGLLKRSDDVAYSEVSNRLYEYYRNPEKDPEVGAALEKIKGDFYTSSLADYYRDHLSLDVIAEAYHCDLTTIKRNKKRLCLRLYQLLQ